MTCQDRIKIIIKRYLIKQRGWSAVEKKQFHKVNKAVVATVLAASGITVVAPAVPTKAKPTFSDVDEKHTHYESIMELYSRGYISGYEDGTFRPGNRVTRGHAAKMLSQALGLNIKTPKNPGFTDVPPGNSYYPYIAALAEAKIISGYSKENTMTGYIDKTFRPNEPITRNQMAKILTLGYEFQLAAKLTHEFSDVTATNQNKYYIQTLYDLGVTQGTTPVTYSPSKAVTRGQLASFIMRAENINAQASKVKEIGDISGSYVYINGAKHYIDASLRNLFNEKNKAVLKGAHIDGQIIGNTLKSVSKLTINAEGTKNRLLIFDGNQSTFAGEVVIQGNYLQFKNWKLTGSVTVAEQAPRTISKFNPLSNAKIASLGKFGFIDWGGGKDEVDEEPDGSFEGIPTTPTSPVPRMGTIEKYIDFTNSTISRLIIQANRTHVAAQYELPHVTVTGNVREYEMYADIKTLYIDTDVNTKMYGVSDIGTAYKNTPKNFYINSDSYINKLIIDSKNGWTDLGDYTYIHTIIIPPGAMPSDVFNDFIKDDGKIGNIIDKDGDKVDRDPVGETIIPDLDDPSILGLDDKVDGSKVQFDVRVNEAGQYYYMILKAGERPPTIRDILENKQGGRLMGTGSNYYASFNVSLEQETKYVIYMVAVDEAGNVSEKVSRNFETRDGTPPVITNLKGEGLIGGTRAQISFRPSEPGRYRYMVLPSSATAPKLEEIMKQPEQIVTAQDVVSGVSFTHRGLSAQTQYTVYMVMTDLSGNPSATKDGEISYSGPFWTQALDNVPPRLTKTVLDNSDITNIDREPTKVVLTFSEQLDPTTATNVANYTLGGTGNLKDRPYKATLSTDGRKVTLEIPSMAAFVNNDTLTITIRNVEDMAGNKILDNLTNNMATYTYKAYTTPILSNLVVNPTVTNPVLADMPQEKRDALTGVTTIHSNKVTFNGNYTGTYYYLIMPAKPGEGVKKPLVSQVVFPRDNYKLDDLFQKSFALASGSGEAVVGDGKDPKLEGRNAFNIYYDPTKIESNSDGYYIYMVMRDRNGNYSNVEVQYFLPNKRDWDLESFTFAGIPNNPPPGIDDKTFYYPADYTDVGNSNYTFDFQMKFNATMDKATVESRANYILEGNLNKYLEIKNITLAENGREATLKLGYKTTIAESDIPVANTYIAYYLTHDQTLDITMKGLKTWATSQAEALAGQTSSEVTNTKKVTLKYFDQLKPRLIGHDEYSWPAKSLSLARRVNANFETNADGSVKQQLPARLELTFSEAVQLPTGSSYANFAELLVTPHLGTGTGSTVTISGIEHAKDKDGKNIEHKLIVTLTGTFKDKESLRMTLKNGTGTVLRDKQSNTIMNTFTVNSADTSAYQAIYVYREMPMEIVYANLRRLSLEDRGGGVSESKGLDVGLKGGYNYPGMKLHYMQATSLSGEITADVIINATTEVSDLFGTHKIENLLAYVPFEAPSNTNQVFRADNDTSIYIVLTDSYGNVSNVVKKVIQRPPNTP